ncbi:MAG TPA: preprotein translocase subunit SecG [Chromatiaceae bacterium]|jgi:preprotein translocase subunit SecG|nr:MAG: hypothetical protein N838_08445 [Thiohalocapsa sp. PB-PSB1]QQO55452.1 MAG: preprotein translocase subunit SecG [Thiohalocapsa sp. PB-PSB1]HBG96671.1 preprotein translocase subunit SecG [Chromatiaceae bacterium]HCS89637.1 preprotein translocase subunit SecG [Chromatiaceae bacterium]
MQLILTVLHLALAIGLVGLILIQHGRGADAGAAFGSGASATVFGAQGSGSFLTRTTGVLATLFFLTSIALAYFAAQVGEPEGLMSGIDAPKPAISEPVVPKPAVDMDDVPVPEDTTEIRSQGQPEAPTAEVQSEELSEENADAAISPENGNRDLPNLGSDEMPVESSSAQTADQIPENSDLPPMNQPANEPAN